MAIPKYLRDVDIDGNIQIESVPKWKEYVYNGWSNSLIWGDCILFQDATMTLIQTLSPMKLVSALRPPGYDA